MQGTPTFALWVIHDRKLPLTPSDKPPVAPTPLSATPITNIDDGADATVSGPDHQGSTVAVEDGVASTTLSLTRHTYTVSLSVDGVTTTTTLTVTR